MQVFRWSLVFFARIRIAHLTGRKKLRPIIDKTFGNLYLSFNPNIDFVVTGSETGAGFAPQFKSVYTFHKIYGVGLEYYSTLGSFKKILPLNQQEHLIGPVIDLYFHPKWEFNAGYLFGLTDNSNQRIFKLLLGKRIGNNTFTRWPLRRR
ncbi:MAG TPA: transporter [Chitinophagaceae bacterium]|nr:transporter [Chitinophagaceae bacterium]